MKIAFISDLHLAPGRLNRCAVPVSEIPDILDRLEDSHDEIIVVGDLYDLSRPPRWGEWQSHRERMRAEFGGVLERLETYPAVFGNHDRERASEGVPERLWRGGTKSIQVTHGHQFDHPIKRIPNLEATANFVAGWSVRAHLSVVSNVLGAVPRMLEVLGKPGTDTSLLGAQSLMETTDARVVVMGHSHMLRAVKTPQGTFINCGSWTEHDAEWASLDLDSGACELWERRRGDFRLVDSLIL